VAKPLQLATWLLLTAYRNNGTVADLFTTCSVLPQYITIFVAVLMPGCWVWRVRVGRTIVIIAAGCRALTVWASIWPQQQQHGHEWRYDWRHGPLMHVTPSDRLPGGHWGVHQSVLDCKQTSCRLLSLSLSVSLCFCSCLCLPACAVGGGRCPTASGRLSVSLEHTALTTQRSQMNLRFGWIRCSCLSGKLPTERLCLPPFHICYSDYSNLDNRAVSCCYFRLGGGEAFA